MCSSSIAFSVRFFFLAYRFLNQCYEILPELIHDPGGTVVGNWPLPKRAGSRVRITSAMALVIIGRDKIRSINQSIHPSIHQSIHQSSKNAAAAQVLCTWLHKQPQLLCCGIFAWDFCLSCPTKRSQVPLRYWFRPRSPLVLVMANCFVPLGQWQRDPWSLAPWPSMGSRSKRQLTVFHHLDTWKAKFFILRDVIFLVRLQGKFEIDQSWEWKSWLHAISRRPVVTAAVALPQVLFPLLEQVKRMSTTAAAVPPPSDTNASKAKILIHHSRDTAEKQWAETRVLTLNGVARVFNNRREILATLEEFPRAWALFLEFIESAALSTSAEVGLAALKSFQEIVHDSPESSQERKISPAEDSAPGAKGRTEFRVKVKFCRAADEDLNLWTNAWRVWFNIGTTGMSASFCIRPRRDSNGTSVTSVNYPSQAFLAALVQIFPQLFRRIYCRFGLADLQKLSSILDSAIRVPVLQDESPFLVPSFQDTMLTSLQHAIIDAVLILREPIPDASGCVLDFSSQPMYPTLFALLLKFADYACAPPKVESHGDAGSQPGMRRKDDWLILGMVPFSEKCLQMTVDLYQICAEKNDVVEERVLESVIKVWGGGGGPGGAYSNTCFQPVGKLQYRIWFFRMSLITFS